MRGFPSIDRCTALLHAGEACPALCQMGHGTLYRKALARPRPCASRGAGQDGGQLVDPPRPGAGCPPPAAAQGAGDGRLTIPFAGNLKPDSSLSAIGTIPGGPFELPVAPDLIGRTLEMPGYPLTHENLALITEQFFMMKEIKATSTSGAIERPMRPAGASTGGDPRHSHPDPLSHPGRYLNPAGSGMRRPRDNTLRGSGSVGCRRIAHAVLVGAVLVRHRSG